MENCEPFCNVPTATLRPMSFTVLFKRSILNMPIQHPPTIQNTIKKWPRSSLLQLKIYVNPMMIYRYHLTFNSFVLKVSFERIMSQIGRVSSRLTTNCGTGENKMRQQVHWHGEIPIRDPENIEKHFKWLPSPNDPSISLFMPTRMTSPQVVSIYQM